MNFELSCAGMNLEGIELGRDDSSCKLANLNIRFDYEIPLPSSWKPRLNNLEELRAEHCWWHEPKNLSFPSVRVLKVHQSTCSSLFSPFGSLQQLRRLEISNCTLLENIMDDVRGDEASRLDKIVTLSNLSDVVLKKLPKLRSFSCTASYSFSMPKLKIVHLFECPRVETFTSMKLSTAKLAYLYTEWYHAEKTEDLNSCIRQHYKRTRSFYVNNKLL